MKEEWGRRIMHARYLWKSQNEKTTMKTMVWMGELRKNESWSNIVW
jgi:hypothetical protein